MTPVSKMMTRSSWITSLTLAAVLGLVLPSAIANEFRSGPVIQGYGEVASQIGRAHV